MTTQKRQRRWYHLTPDRFFVGLLVAQVFLLLSDRFQWFAFKEKKGWTVPIAVSVVGLAVLVMLGWGLICLCLRRQFQFGVRSLLVFLLAVSVPLGWFDWELEKARKQKEAVEGIMVLGNSVRYEYRGKEVYVSADGTTSIRPTWMPKMLGDNFFFEVVFVDCDGGESQTSSITETG
jgi:hypothetical protein